MISTGFRKCFVLAASNLRAKLLNPQNRHLRPLLVIHSPWSDEFSQGLLKLLNTFITADNDSLSQLNGAKLDSALSSSLFPSTCKMGDPCKELVSTNFSHVLWLSIDDDIELNMFLLVLYLPTVFCLAYF